MINSYDPHGVTNAIDATEHADKTTNHDASIPAASLAENTM